MVNIDLNIPGKVDYFKAADEACKLAEDAGGSFSLLAWYDRGRGTGAPQEVCSLENWKCVRDYAEHHRADLRVSVNDDEYEFYFFRVPADVEELDREEVETVHTGIARDQFDNVQGG